MATTATHGKSSTTHEISCARCPTKHTHERPHHPNELVPKAVVPTGWVELSREEHVCPDCAAKDPKLAPPKGKEK